MSHTSFRIDRIVLGRIDALKPLYGSPYVVPTRAELVRILLNQALALNERRAKTQGRAKPRR